MLFEHLAKKSWVKLTCHAKAYVKDAVKPVTSLELGNRDLMSILE
jgi:hypothetical protein